MISSDWLFNPEVIPFLNIILLAVISEGKVNEYHPSPRLFILLDSSQLGEVISPPQKNKYISLLQELGRLALIVIGVDVPPLRLYVFTEDWLRQRKSKPVVDGVNPSTVVI